MFSCIAGGEAWGSIGKDRVAEDWPKNYTNEDKMESRRIETSSNTCSPTVIAKGRQNETSADTYFLTAATFPSYSRVSSSR